MFVRDIQQPSVCVYGSLLIVFRYRPKLVFVSLLKINGETFRNNLGRRRGNLIFGTMLFLLCSYLGPLKVVAKNYVRRVERYIEHHGTLLKHLVVYCMHISCQIHI